MYMVICYAFVRDLEMVAIFIYVSFKIPDDGHWPKHVGTELE